jgi:hypothetical protein
MTLPCGRQKMGNRAGAGQRQNCRRNGPDTEVKFTTNTDRLGVDCRFWT